MLSDHTIKQFIEAAKRGDTSEVQRMLPLCSNPKDEKSVALRYAAKHGHAECVKLLIPVSDPKALHSRALCLAAEQGHGDCVKLLIPVSDPKAKNSWTLQMACFWGHNDCVDLLFDVSEPQGALNELQRHYSNYPERWQYLADKIAAVQQRAVLTHEVSVDKNTRKTTVRKI